MHKYFANSLFLGKKYIYLPQCHSTNAIAIDLIRKEGGNHGTLILTDDQTNGKGQQGNVWISEPDKNLLFTLILKTDFLHASKAYLLNVMACLALRDTISRLLTTFIVDIKWPNDLYIDGKKISGILTETILRGSQIDYSVIGIGLNVNQEHFSLPNAISLCNLSNKPFDRSLIMDSFLKSLEHYFLMLKSMKYAFLIDRYHENLMWKEEEHYFEDNSGDTFYGTIEGIDEFGRLNIRSGEETKPYDVKQVSFLH